MNTALLNQYETAMRKKRELEAYIEVLKFQVVEEVKKNGQLSGKKDNAMRIDGNGGSFIVTQTQTYTFSTAVDRAALALKSLKLKEISDGVAKATEKDMLIFRQK